MNLNGPVIKPFGERTILITWAPVIDERMLELLLFYKERIRKKRENKIGDIIHTYHALAVVYYAPINNLDDEISILKSLISESVVPGKSQHRRYRIPVCYDLKFGLDLEVITDKRNLSIPEIIALHTAPIFIIYFMGFLPGFLYLGGLVDKLFMDRKEIPRKKIARGAVGIGGRQTGIYPSSSPGGWQIIGNCPLNLFDPHQDPPSVFQAGDHIQLYPISPEQHASISEEVATGRFQLKPQING